MLLKIAWFLLLNSPGEIEEKGIKTNRNRMLIAIWLKTRPIDEKTLFFDNLFLKLGFLFLPFFPNSPIKIPRGMGNWKFWNSPKFPKWGKIGDKPYHLCKQWAQNSSAAVCTSYTLGQKIRYAHSFIYLVIRRE